MGVGLIRFQPEGFPEYANRLINLAFLDEGDAEVVVGEGVIRFQANCLWYWRIASSIWPFIVERDAEAVMRDVIVLRDLERVPEKGFTVLPIPELLPRQRQAEDDRR